MIKVFISGPMSGIKDFNKNEFMRAEKLLREAGFSVFNPAWLDLDESWDTSEIAAIDMAALTKCDAIYQLEGWEDSKGAVAEYKTAKWLGIDILHESNIRAMLKREDSYVDYLKGMTRSRIEHRFW